MANELATVETPAEVSSLVALALREKVPVEVLERLVALQERVTAQAAESAMARALAAFQAECPPIRRVKTATVKKEGVKQYEYDFAPFEEVARTIRDPLAKHGLSYSHDNTFTDKGVEVTCTLHHAEGAKRTATFRGPVDTSGGKNPIQQVASARSYGRRYSLIDVLGLAIEDDDDGQAAGEGGEPITVGQEADLRAMIRETGTNEQKFCEFFEVESLGKILARDYTKAVRLLEERRAKARAAS